VCHESRDSLGAMQQREVFSVSSLTQLIRGTLEDRFPEVLVEGEVSNFRPSAAGHWYFSLKDEGALLSAVMFLGNNRRTPFQPRDGDLLEVSGSISVYPPRGTYQLIVRRMERAGTGQILQILEERKRAFEAEGLFGRRRALPAVPRRIAVITSPTGAAIRDVIHVLSRRAAPAQVLVVPVPVQGDCGPTGNRCGDSVCQSSRPRRCDDSDPRRGVSGRPPALQFRRGRTRRCHILKYPSSRRSATRWTGH
jgi:exonuclease VII large subunit